MPNCDAIAALAQTSRIGLRSGPETIVRAVSEADGAGLQDYIRGLSVRSRYSRMLGASSELPPSELQAILHPVDSDHVALIATLMIEGRDHIVGEARLVHDPEAETVELALSVGDRWQKLGLGSAMFADLQRRAAMLGPVDLFGDTLRTNDAMLGLAHRFGFKLFATPGDWRLVRFQKSVVASHAIVPQPGLANHAVTDRG